ncbi:MAG TPA: AsmA-like C-terminal region-containing protein [Planctomycetota bacterium]|nr:AsmA-like C-terminal region-containing protein [Planctomycetota bacterium]
MWKTVKWLFVLVLVMFLGIMLGGPYILSSEPGRKEIAAALAKALHRQVTIGKLDVGFLFSSIELKDLAIRNPEGYPEASLFQADGLKLDIPLGDAMKGTFKGSLKGDGLEVLFQRKGGGTNLDGIGSPKGGGTGEEKVPDLDLSLELTDSKVTIEDLDKGESLVLDGVGVWMRLTNKADERNTGIRIRVDSIDRNGVHVRDLQLDAKESDGWLDLEKIEAHFAGQGQLSGTGRLQLQGGDAWQAKLNAQAVKLTDDLMPIVGSLYPLAAKAEGQADGQIDASFDVRGSGLTWEAMKPNLVGTGQVLLTGLQLPAGSVVAKLGEFAGRPPGGIQVKDAGASFGLGQGWIAFNRLSAETHEARYDLAGRVSLDGQLDLTMDLLPLVKQFGGGKAFKDVSKHVDKIPVAIKGTSAAPRFALPKAEDLAKGILEKKAEEGLGDILDKIKKK